MRDHSIVFGPVFNFINTLSRTFCYNREVKLKIKKPKTERLKMALIILSAAALALCVLTIIIVFYPTGSYQAVVVQGPSAASFSNLPSSTAAAATSSSGNASNTVATVPPGTFASDYSAPYPATWTEGRENFAITGAALQGNQLTLSLAIKMGTAAECVPVNLRLVADESGTLAPPNSPASGTFTFPDTQSCNGTPGATYSQSITFTIAPSAAPPYLFTTSGTSNVFFTVATNTANGLDIVLPGNSG